MRWLQMLYVVAAFFGAAIVHASSVLFELKRDMFEIIEGAQEVSITKNHDVILKLKTKSEEKNSLVIEDYNFDGYPDVAVAGDFGVERYFDVYLFDPKTASFMRNDLLSSLPCPFPNSKDRTIVASCNHANACETWEDTYRYIKGKFSLVRRNGNSCDPGNGKEFRYFQIHRNNKVIRQRSYLVEEK